MRTPHSFLAWVARGMVTDVIAAWSHVLGMSGRGADAAKVTGRPAAANTAIARSRAALDM